MPDAQPAITTGEDENGLWLELDVALEPGQRVSVEKIVAVYTDDDADGNSPSAALHAARTAASFATLEHEHREAWARLWKRFWIHGSSRKLEQIAHFHAFHLLQTASPLSCRRDAGFPARGWQEGYYGHIFCDELFAFPFFSLHFPEIARGLLLYRYQRLGAVRDAAREAGLRGAMYPWRSARSGAEETRRCSTTPSRAAGWRTTPTCNGISARPSHSTYGITISPLFEWAGDMLVEIARFWASLAQRNAQSGHFELRGVIGPDEYHTAYPGAVRPGLNNNAYTNVMATWTLCRALDLVERMPAARRAALVRRLALADDELRNWDKISRGLAVPFIDDNIIGQFDGYSELKPAAEAEALLRPQTRIDWSLEAGGDSVNAYQITKQADVLMLLHLFEPRELEGLLHRLGYQPPPDWARATVDYYLSRISHESSLSQPACAGALSTIDPEGSWRYYQEAMETDLGRGHGTSSHEGLHLGAMGGTLDVLQRHYLGVQPELGGLQLAPHPPPALDNLTLYFHYCGQDFDLALRGQELSLTSQGRNQRAIRVFHESDARTLAPGRTLRLKCR